VQALKKKIIPTGQLSFFVMQLEREADHSPPACAEIKNAWRYTSTSSIYIHDAVLRI
jgi:hypothetical protein